MARKQKLKVYRTPIGFHDAYVAAPSQKGALKAWGADVDLFARGVAEVVVDEEVTREPLEKPGTVVRRLRGTTDEHMAALPKEKPARKRSTVPDEDEAPAPRRRKTASRKPVEPERSSAEESREHASAASEETPKKVRSSPRPSRARLDKAEQALETAEARHNQAITEIRGREKELQQRRRDLEKRHETEVENLETAISKARASYGAALEKWRG